MERKKVETFEDLWVWQKGISLVRRVYVLTESDKLRREYINFLNIAKGSAGELRSLLQVALEVGFLRHEEYAALKEETMALSRYLANQIASLRKSGTGTPARQDGR